MDKQSRTYQAYVQILKEELIPAMGCTEPIAIAYAAAKARDVLGGMPDKVEIGVSSNIIKNVKSVIVPNTGHLKGMEAAVAAGIIAGSADRELEVISEVSEDKKAAIRDYLQTVPISIQHIEQGHVFDIIVTERSGDSYAKVRIADFHTNICLIEKNGRVLYEKPLLNEEARRDSRADRSLLNMKDIWDFAETADLQDVADLLERQIRYNNAIAEEGLLGDYGANIGQVLLSTYGNDVSIRAKAKAAAGSDARMNGCELPVIINSGSGNQGITCSVPLIEYAKELHSGKELPAEADPGETAEAADTAPQGETAGLTVEIPLDKAAVGNLTKLLDAKGSLIKKALGVDALPIEIQEDRVAFPWFSELPDADAVKAYTHFISALCEMSKNAKRVTVTEKAVENEKYAFRCFLLRLGFIGTEYKAERKILLKNLTGSSAFKNGGADHEVSE